MTTTTVTIAAADPSSTGARAHVLIQLVGEDALPVAGYVLGDNEQIVRNYESDTDSSGVLSVGLVPNAEITPAGTAYKATVTSRGRRESIVFEVPVGGGTHDIGDLVTDPPASIASAALSTHIADTVDAHDATAVSFTPSGSIAATTVQAALVEVASDAVADLAAHTGDAVDAHDATAVSFTRSGGVSRTVQAAVESVAVTPQDFGAVADGVTSDLVALNAAATAAAGTVLLLPGGSYAIDARWRLPSDIEVVFAAGAELVTPAGCTFDAIVCDGTDQTLIRPRVRKASGAVASSTVAGVAIRGNASDTKVVDGYSEGMGRGLDIAGVESADTPGVVRNVTVDGFTSVDSRHYGCTLGDCDTVTLRRFRSTGSGLDGVKALRAAYNVTGDDWDCSDAAGGDGLDAYGGAGQWSLTNMRFHDNGVGGCIIKSSTDNATRSVTITAADDTFAINPRAFTVTAADNVFTAVGHGLAERERIVFTSIGTATGFSADTTYFARDVTADTFKISTSVTGGVVDVTADGSGVFVNPHNQVANTDIVLIGLTGGAGLSDGPVYYVRDAVRRRGTDDALITEGSPVVTSDTIGFTAGDVGNGIAGSGIPTGTTILSVESATSVTMSANATATDTVTLSVTPPADTLRLAATNGGAAIDITTDGSGRITLSTESTFGVAFTAEADDNRLTVPNHRFTDGETVVLTELTGGGGLAARPTYYIRDLTKGTFKVAATSGGAAIDITSNGSASYGVAGFDYIDRLQMDNIKCWNNTGYGFSIHRHSAESEEVPLEPLGSHIQVGSLHCWGNSYGAYLRARGVQIADLMVVANRKHGLVVDEACFDIQIGRVLAEGNGTEAAGTYDGINVQDFAQVRIDQVISNGSSRRGAYSLAHLSAATAYQRYGIQVEAGATCNVKSLEGRGNLTALSTGLLVDGRAVVVKSADETVTSSIASQSDDELRIALPAYGTFEFEANLYYDGATTGDLRVGFSVPTGATIMWNQLTVQAAASGSSAQSMTVTVITASGTLSSVAGAVGAGTRLPFRARGVVVMGGTAGNLATVWAQGTSDATATTIFARSMLRVTQVA